MATLVLTSCTSRKRIPVGARLPRLPSARAAHRYGGGVAGLAQAWMAAVTSSPAIRQPVGELYVGRSFADARAAAEALGAELSVVSAGLGLIASHEQAPAYELTVADGAGSVLPRLGQLGASIEQWWPTLNFARCNEAWPIAQRIASGRFGRVMLALPARYLELVSADLAKVPLAARHAVRIFTSPAGREAAPVAWRDHVLPYDERLDGEGSPRRGTRVDFAQRAMRHFVEDLGATALPLDKAHAAVEQALSGLQAPTLPPRRRLADDELLELLRTHWAVHSGQSSRLLRFLRDDAQVACEQSRFRSLWLRARAELDPQP